MSEATFWIWYCRAFIAWSGVHAILAAVHDRWIALGIHLTAVVVMVALHQSWTNRRKRKATQ